jgi:hypothetical protein
MTERGSGRIEEEGRRRGRKKSTDYYKNFTLWFHFGQVKF